MIACDCNSSNSWRSMQALSVARPRATASRALAGSSSLSQLAASLRRVSAFTAQISIALENAKLFVLTENQERADAVMKGAAEDLVFTDVHSSSESLNAHANLGTSRSTRERGGYAGFGAGESESNRSSERRHEALAAIRLVNKEGDVIWSTTQESLGAKFRGSSVDVADKITAKLREDYDRARKLK